MTKKTLLDFAAVARVARSGGVDLGTSELEKIVLALVNVCDALESLTPYEQENLLAREFGLNPDEDGHEGKGWGGPDAGGNVPDLAKLALVYPAREFEPDADHAKRLQAIKATAEMLGGDDDYNDGMGNPVRARWDRLTSSDYTRAWSAGFTRGSFNLVSQASQFRGEEYADYSAGFAAGCKARKSGAQ